LDQICEHGQNLNPSILVFCHIAPSVSTRNHLNKQRWQPKYLDRFAELSFRDKFMVTCGHFHFDMFVPIFNSRGRRGGFVTAAPALSPRYGSNPTFKVIKLRNGIVMDYDQFYGEIVENPKEEVEWKFEYSFVKVYGENNL
jgi:sphingomyelin phosphodiesterase acid-like 3